MVQVQGHLPAAESYQPQVEGNGITQRHCPWWHCSLSKYPTPNLEYFHRRPWHHTGGQDSGPSSVLTLQLRTPWVLEPYRGCQGFPSASRKYHPGPPPTEAAEDAKYARKVLSSRIIKEGLPMPLEFHQATTPLPYYAPIISFNVTSPSPVSFPSLSSFP